MSYLDDMRSRLKIGGANQSEKELSYSKREYMLNFKDDPSYKMGILRKSDLTEIPIDTRIINVDRTVIEKRIQILPDNVCSMGDYIVYPNKTYLVLEFEDNSVVPYAKAFQCIQTINLKGWDKPIPCVATNDSYGVKLNESNEFFAFRDAKVKIQVQKNNITKKIKNGTRFIFDNSEDNVYRVIDKTSVIDKGIIIFMMEKTEKMSEDDLINNIAYNDSVQDIPKEYNIIGAENIKIGTQQTYIIEPVGIDIAWEIDDLEIGKIISQSNNNCIIEGIGTTDELLIITAMQNGKTIATKYVNIIRK